MRLPHRLIPPAAFLAAAVLAILGAILAAGLVESRSASGVRKALDAAGLGWAQVRADGLKVLLSGTAPNETERFRAVSTAGSVIDAANVRDDMEVADSAVIDTPEFTVEILRNDDGISLIGLVPAGTARDEIKARVTAIAGGVPVTDLLESAKYPVPDTWPLALDFGLSALADLPRSKISITAPKVAIVAITDSAAEKARIEADLARRKPEAVALERDISAPRPVIAPFTLRFLIDEQGARFDACSANNERARDRILAAANDAGAPPQTTCTIGLGVPSPQWADAVTLGIGVLADLGAGSITFSDADVSLIAAPSVDQAAFDEAVGRLESNLPEVFSLRAELTPKPEAQVQKGPAVFTAALAADGKVTLGGRITDETARDSVESYARSRFGSSNVDTAMRLETDLPEGWPLRALVGLQALAELAQGQLTVTAEDVTLTGVSGSQDARDSVSRMLAAGLGKGAKFRLDIRYDAKLDPLLGLPTPEQCIARINDELAAHKLAFEPGSATFTPDSAKTLDTLAGLMKDCTDVPIEVAGHTDSQGREEMNLALSEDRAEAVVAALLERRVPTSNLTAVGYGETVPIADNGSEAGREANRRIEFRLLSPETSGAETAATGDATAEAPAAAASGDPAEAAGTATATPDGSITIEVRTPQKDTVRPQKRPEGR